MIFLTPTEGNVHLAWDGTEFSVWTCTEPKERIGEFTFKSIDLGEGTECFLVTGMHLEGPSGTGRFKGQGIGREILRRVFEIEGIFPVFRRFDGLSHEDGSHLTGDGPEFAAKMVTEGAAGWL